MSQHSNVAKIIELITREDEHTTRSERMELVSKALDVTHLRERFKEFMESLQSIVDVGEGISSGLPID